MDALLSNLPDEILCHILSFLTAKEAALTSVLSKRWRNLVAFVPNLDIDDSDILYPEKYKEERDDIGQLFKDFVDRVLALQGDSPINKFSLYCMGVDSDRLDAWIRNVMVRGVSELDLSIFPDMVPEDNIRLFPKVFANKKLVKLKLSCGFDICWLDGEIFLPMLKTLVLESVGFSNDNFEILLHALPSLEELVLEDIYWKDLDVNVSLSSASLKAITINSIGFLDSFTLDTPSLDYFCYSDNYVVEHHCIAKMENLFEARISLFVIEEDIRQARAPNNDLFDDDDDGNVALGFANLGKLMNGIQKVRYLFLSSDTLEVLSLCCESLPVFNNLKKLAIKSDKDRGWQAMPVLLRKCPHLETLVLQGLLHHVTDKCGDACNCISREDIRSSLTSCPVKVLKIQKFQGTRKEMHMIKHFLDYFPYLKEIKIYLEENGPTQLRVHEVSEAIAEMMEHYNKSSSCDVQLLVSD